MKLEKGAAASQHRAGGRPGSPLGNTADSNCCAHPLKVVGLSRERFRPLGDTWQCLQTFLVLTGWGGTCCRRPGGRRARDAAQHATVVRMAHRRASPSRVEDQQSAGEKPCHLYAPLFRRRTM